MSMQSESNVVAMPFFTMIWDAFGTELALLALFCAGFVLFRASTIQSLLFGPPKSWQHLKLRQERRDADSKIPPTSSNAVKQLVTNWAAGRADLVLDAWSSLEFFTLDVLKAVVEAAVASHREFDVNSIIQQILAKHENMCSREAMNVALEALPQSQAQLAASIRSSFVKAFSKSTKPIASCFQAPAPIVSAEEASLATGIIDAVQAKQFDQAKTRMSSMRAAGYKVPGSCFVTLVREAKESHPAHSILKEISADLFSVDSIVALIEHAIKIGDSTLLRDMNQRTEAMIVHQEPAVCEALLRCYAALGDSRAVEVFDDIVARGFAPSEGVLTAIISLCADSRHIQMAEHALKYARRTNVNAPLSLYAAMVKVYGHAQLYDKTCNLYEVMRQDAVEPDTVVYGSLIKAAVESGRLDLARRLFRESGNPDLLNYMSLIRAAGREKDLPKALALLEELEAAPVVTIDATAYNCVLEVCVSSGNRAAATKLLKRMEDKNHVDVVSYNTFLKILFADGAHLEIENVMLSMRGRGLKPNAVTYNSLVKDAITRQDMQKAWGLIGQMEADGTNPDAFTCSILMKGVKHAASSEVVDKVVDLIQRLNVTPDEVLMNCLLEAYVRLRNIPRLSQILEQFKGTGVVPSPHACALLIKAYGHSQRLDKAWALWHELINERKLTPNEEVFASMVDACLAAGDLENAIVVFREMKHVLSDFNRGPAVFGALIKACISRKQTKQAVEIYEEMSEANFTCNKVTYNTLIDALVRQGDTDKATAVFRDMSLKAVTPDLISYATLIKGHCARGCLDQGLQLFGLMQRRGISPDAIVFNSILDGCAHKQMRTLTEQVLKDMETAGIAPSNFTLSILVKLYGRCSDLDTAFEVVDTYPEKYKFKLNAQVYTCLMSACIANGSLPRALEVYKKMGDAGCATDSKVYQTLLNGCVRHSDLDAAACLMKDVLQQKSAYCLDREAVENVLFMMARRGRKADLALPLLDQLEAAGVRVSERVSSTVRKSDAPSTQTRHSTRTSA